MEWLGFTREAQEVTDSSDCVLARPLRATQVPLSAVLKEIELIVVHVFRIGLLRRAIVVLAVAIPIPVVAERAELPGCDERFKGKDRLSVPLIVRGAQEFHVVDLVASVSLGGKQLWSESLSELERGGGLSAPGFATAVPLVNEESEKRSTANRKTSGDDLDW